MVTAYFTLNDNSLIEKREHFKIFKYTYPSNSVISLLNFVSYI